MPGQNGGKLGGKYDPFEILQHPDEDDFSVEPLALRGGMDSARWRHRTALRDTFNESGSHKNAQTLLQMSSNRGMRTYFERAAELVLSPEARRAFDLSAEKDAMRDRYGRQTFGQSVLLARRLLEAGVQLVTVYWHRDKPGVDTTWDTHSNNFSSLKERLIPQIDQPIAYLLEDLKLRGMLEDTLIVWTSEFGRTPKVNTRAGRDHWGRCNTIWMAGAGVPGGQVHGSSDKYAAEPDLDPVGPADVTATIFHLLGVSPSAYVQDRENRPHQVAPGSPISALLG